MRTFLVICARSRQVLVLTGGILRVQSLKKLLETAKIVPVVNQIEMHPHQAQPELLEFCKQHNITLTAYSPTGYAQVATDPTVAQLAEKYKVSPAQISLAWHVARGTSAVPKSSNEGRQKANLLVRHEFLDTRYVSVIANPLHL